MKTEAKYLKNSLSDNITTGLIAGITAAIVNVLYFLAYNQFSGFHEPFVNIYMVILASLIPGIFSGVLYFIINRYFQKDVFKGFSFVIIIATLFSFLGPYALSSVDSVNSSEGLYLLTLPMHFIVGLTIIFVMNSREN
jgi:MFS superfamily sulfate permease-like transporter